MTGPLAVPPTRIVPVHGTRGAGLPPGKRLKLGDALVLAGVITPAQLEHCLNVQQRCDPPRRLGTVVVELGLATDVDVARGLATILGFDFVDPAALDVPLDAVRRLPRDRSAELGVVPIGAGPTWIRVAVADPNDRNTLDAIRETTGLLNVSLAVATPSSIGAALLRFWSPSYVPPPAADPAPETAAAAPPDDDAEPVAEPAPPGEGWEYAFVGAGLPDGHQGRTDDLAGTERTLARLGTEGWEAVGVQADLSGLTVLLKRRT